MLTSLAIWPNLSPWNRVPRGYLNHPKNDVDVYILFTISKKSRDLTQDKFTQYQNKLYETICQKREIEGLTFPQIADYLNKCGYKTVRKTKWNNPKVHSVYTKRKKRLEIKNEKSLSEITDFQLYFVDKSEPE